MDTRGARWARGRSGGRPRSLKVSATYRRPAPAPACLPRALRGLSIPSHHTLGLRRPARGAPYLRALGFFVLRGSVPARAPVGAARRLPPPPSLPLALKESVLRGLVAASSSLERHRFRFGVARYLPSPPSPPRGPNACGSGRSYPLARTSLITSHSRHRTMPSGAEQEVKSFLF